MVNIKGAFSAIVTPFTSDGSKIVEGELRALVDRTIEAGADGIIPCGGTGEFIALSSEERRSVVEIVIDQTAKRVPVIPQTGGLSTREAIDHTAHAADSGADGVMIAPPFYEPISRESAIEYFVDVAGSTKLPIMLYNYPNGTGLRMDADLISELVDASSNIKYIKDSSADPFLMSQLVTEYAKVIGTFCGEDVLMGAALTVGVQGLVTGCFNFMMPVVARMTAAAESEDYETLANLWKETLPLVVCLASNPYTSAVKTACSILGHDVGPVRRPLPMISAQGRKSLAANISALDPSYFA